MKNSAFGVFIGLFLAANIYGQVLPSVSVVASDPLATEPGPANLVDTGAFTISRSGPTNFPLMVFFTLGGTASNGVDYLQVEPTVTIREGERAARVFIVPLSDNAVEGEERAILRIVPSPMAGPGSGYILPTNSLGAAVTIRDQLAPSNAPPNVQITSPANGRNYQAPANIGIAAETVDPDGWVPTVEFFANGAKIGESTINFIVAPPDGTPIAHEFKWDGVGVGDYVLTALATDDQGAKRTSLPVRISVTDSNIPPRTIVSIRATDPQGSEIPEVPPGMGRPQLIDPAIFTVSRSANFDIDLTVYYRVSGRASNGVDYVEIPSAVKIPAGAPSAAIEINVIDDLLAEGTENVVIQLVPPICPAIFPPPPECYVVLESTPGNLGSGAIAPSRAEAFIIDNDFTPSNRPPVVSIVLPTDGAVFKAPADIQIVAHAFDSDGYVHTVEFFEGTNSLGVTTNNPFAANVMNPFQLKWSEVTPGRYVLTALATDNDGAQSKSRQVFITVVEEPIRQTVVNIRAVDPEAAEQDPRLDSLQNNALLRVVRTGPTDFDLPVYYHVDGTAENGVDYARLSGRVLIPKDSEFADIVIEAIDDKIAERTESLLVTLEPPVCIAIFPPPPECYVVGSAGRAMAFILDDEPIETNLPPRVEITQPSSGATFRAPADIHIVAKTADRDGYVGKVEFFANGHKIGEASKEFLVPPPDGSTIEYDFDWQDVRPGQYALSARAIDEEGASAFSPPVRISVIGTNTPPPTNVAVVTVYAIDGHASEGSNIITTNDPRMLLPYDTNGIRPPNVAVFEIRRSGGNTDIPLRVFYETHGTASEGVDYLDLPGIAEIPAGQRSARVVVVPIDDQLPEKLESVVICLRPSPVLAPIPGALLPGYVVGRPGSAAAVIADNDMPRVPYFCLGDGLINWSSPAASGECFRIEASADLREWTELCTTRANDGALHYTDSEAMAYDRRFYRAVPVPCPAEP